MLIGVSSGSAQRLIGANSLEEEVRDSRLET